MSLRHKRKEATLKLPYKIKLGLTLCRILCPGGISISCKEEMKDDIQKQTTVQGMSSPSSIILYVPLQTASSLRTFTIMTPKVKNFVEFTCNMRKIYTFFLVPECNAEAWCCAFPVHHGLFRVLVSLNNIFVTFEDGSLCSLSSKALFRTLQLTT